MRKIGAFQSIFGKAKQLINVKRYHEIGKYNSNFYGFGTDIYKSEIIKSCVRPLADYSSKANAKCNNKNIEKLLQNRPNVYMNGKDFLYKIRTIYEIKNTVFIYIDKDNRGNVLSFYPVPCQRFEAVEYANELYIKFYYASGKNNVLPWEQLAVLRKDYYSSDIAGDDNTAILDMLELINTTNQGVANAVKATANLRGILKSTKAMLSQEDIKKNKETFVKDYLSLENEGGIAALDGSQEFTPITMSPTITNYMQMKEFRENVYRYFGVNDKIIMGDCTEEERESFYQAKIEPFLLALSLELTNKTFTDRERGFNNSIIFESNKLQFASYKTKISVFKEVVLYGGMTVNEWRCGCNMSPLDGGDKPIRRLDAAPVSDVKGGEEDE